LGPAAPIGTFRATMPETPMNKYACLASHENKIGFPRQV
jgi:hypothetical protein